MTSLGPVLVGVDFSPSSRRALEIAAAVSARAGAPLEVIHVWNANHLAGSGTVLPALRSWIADQKNLLVGRLNEWAEDATADGLEVNCRIVDGAASHVIPVVAEESGARLIVVGRLGAADLPHVLLGSVSERVAHLAPCPVLVVPEAATPASASRRLLVPRRLLVGVDFSDAALNALQAAIETATWLEIPEGLLVVHAGAENREADAASADAEGLNRWVHRVEGEGVRIQQLILTGPIDQTLIEAAGREGCDWLVVGAEGQTGLAALLMGSTTDRVLKLADRPILVIPRTSSAIGEVTS